MCRSSLDGFHLVERTIHKVEGYKDEGDAEVGRQVFEAVADGNLHSKHTKECGELDDGVEGHRAGVLEWVAHGVAHYASVVQWSALGFEVDLNNLLGIVPSTTGIGHKYCLEQTEDCDRDQVANEEANCVVTANSSRRRQASEAKREAEDGDEDVEHTFLCILGADAYNLLALADVGLLGRIGIELDVVLDEVDGAVGTSGNSLH